MMKKNLLRTGLLIAAVSITSYTLAADARKEIHSTDAVYPAVGPYSQMVQTGETYYLSGVIPLDISGSAIQGESIEEQTHQVLRYIAEMLAAQDMTLANVVMSTVYMTDLTEFGQMNGVYGEYFSEQPPARATVGVVALPRGVKIEISVVASK
jgi:2-iminobutanoate/2-iminopropanoate deaminase